MPFPTHFNGPARRAWALAAGLACLPAAAAVPMPPRLNLLGRPARGPVRYTAAEAAPGVALRAKVTREVIARWSPDVRFHEWERYFPSSAEAIFKGAKAFRVGSKESERIGADKVINTPADLAGLTAEWRIQFDPNNPKVLDGDVTGARPKMVVTAPMYVAVQVAADGSYVNLGYWFLFGFNGSQSMRSHDGTGSFNYTMRTMAEHEGDWEGVTIRLTRELDKVIMITTEAHGDRKDYLPGEMDWTDKTHPQLRLALNSHGVYNGKGKNPNDWITLEDLKVASVIDIITKDGPTWRPWTLPDAFRIFGRYKNKNQLGKEPWTTYMGRMGTHKNNSASSVVDVTGQPLSGKQAFTAKAQLTVFKGVSPFLKSLFNGMPCAGVGARQELNCELPALRRLSGHRKYVIRPRIAGNLVLSINRSNPDGGLVLDTLRPGDPTQRWYVLQNKHNVNGRLVLDSVSLANVATERLAGMRGGQGSAITLWHRSVNDGTTRWTIQGDRTGNCAIRPLNNSSQNLNVLGNGPYRPGSAVSTWAWGRGQGNETWTIREE
jgi:hypothetical protein